MVVHVSLIILLVELAMSCLFSCVGVDILNHFAWPKYEATTTVGVTLCRHHVVIGLDEVGALFQLRIYTIFPRAAENMEWTVALYYIPASP